MPLFETIPINVDCVRSLVDQHWSLTLGGCLRASQNHTFEATSTDGSKYIVRVTPNPDERRHNSYQVEQQFLDFLHNNALPVCRMIASQLTGKHVIESEQGPMVVAVFPFASGEPVPFLDWQWMVDKQQVHGLARWMAQLHSLSRKFARDRAELLVNARNWDELHDGIIAGVAMHDDDVQSQSDANRFGLIHGDVHRGNFFWNNDTAMPCVFDWDQLQLGWFTYDIAQPLWTIHMLKGAGSPVDQSPVPLANPEQYTEWFLEAYEASGDKVKVDRDELQRMLRVRRELYRRFCHKALDEEGLDPESVMGKFCRYVIDWLDREAAATSTTA
jgi:aminoglycoside phosphotransferase (APT) family kinase protein